MRKIFFVGLVAVFLFGCVSVPLKIDNLAQKEYDVLGEAEGSAVGIMLFNVIPIGQNTRFERAYDAAVQSKGGDALLTPEISESWFWAWILNGYKTTVKGTVIKFRD